MKFVITAGGTAGHINPALALAEELTKRGHDVVFVGTPNRLESKLVPQQGYKFKAFEAYGFNRNHPMSLIKALSSIEKSTKAAKTWLKEYKPNAVIGFGCYVSLSICRAAKNLKIPFIIHEQNSVMGIANKQLSKYASATCLTYKQADTGRCKNVHVCGNPVRSNILTATKKEGRDMLNIPDSAFVLLVFGGSLGAEHINKALLSVVDNILESKNVYIVHVTGKDQYEHVEEGKSSLNMSEDKNNRYRIYAYQDEMPKTMAAADVCISRAGASTLAEITARCLPSLLIPYPHATENHQYYNAKSLMDEGCVMYINDSDLLLEDGQNASDLFIKKVQTLVEDKDKRQSMVESFKQQKAGANAVEELADIVIDCADKS